MMISYYSLPQIFVAIYLLISGVFVYWCRKTKANFAFFLMCFGGFVWLMSYAVLYSLNKDSYNLAVFFSKVGYAGITLIPLMYYQFVVDFLKIKTRMSFSIYILGGIFILLILGSSLIISGVYRYFWGFYPRSGVLHPLYLLFTLAVYLFCLSKLFIAAGKASVSSLEWVRIKYLFWAFFIGNIASIDFIQNYGIAFYPIGFVNIGIFMTLIGYAVIRYRLMDISVVLTRTSIFIAVYSLVLGLPFFLAFGAQDWLKRYVGEMWWLTPLILLTVLATAGPFIYLYIQRRAEEKLFEDQRRYQATLRQAATGMGRIKDMNKLIGLIVHIVTRSVRIEHSIIFVKDPAGKKYVFEGARSRQEEKWQVKEIDGKSPLVRMINKVRQPIVYSEIYQKAADTHDQALENVVKQMEGLKAELVVPSFIDENLIAFMVLGQKISGELYSNDDIAVFSILASQAALAIENCQFYKDMRATHEQLFQAEKMATIGIMADGLSHQINNRLHALGFIAGDALDTISLKKDIPMADELKEMIVDLEHALSRIQENVTQGGEIVRGLLKYSRKQDEELSEVELDELLDESLKMAQFKIKKDSMDVVRDFPSGLPKIKGNFAELQEVFFNLIDNAYDAMMQRKDELKEEGYRPTIEIKAEARGNNRMSIIIRDNGIGIKEEDQVKIFTPFFTTKLSSKKGTGLGLYVIQKLIEENHKGKVVYKSEYMHGTRVYVTLPTC